MKLGLALVVIAALVVGFLIGRAIRNGIKAAAAQRQALARDNARWTVFVDPDGSEIVVGVERVARSGKYRERLDYQVTKRIDCDMPHYERDTEVRIAKGDAQTFADTLNGN